ncbi:MAG: photosystem II cytochrome PsbV2 [Jaaginema sp. PMC 1079.18]|nr:photosystem II cytochrome PsbV2 [Jaaginema sp. PMC 1080.18]MEC4852762.1 photosystem II cytochrome PsbV2 [Jaaginema sp. PMC 1079.18]MEC4866828.1 photosystem II cytochrome PsbV2 [Jaaginema sp. PMC 1078.18]
MFSSILRYFCNCRLFLVLCCVGVVWLSNSAPAWAGDSYIRRYIAKEPVAVKYTNTGETKTYTPEEFEKGKELFKEDCIYCHVGGATVQDPRVTLSTEDLAGATPPRDSVVAIADYMRNPMTYDGSDISIWCRQVDWLSRDDLEILGAFILRAAEKSPGWGRPVESSF